MKLYYNTTLIITLLMAWKITFADESMSLALFPTPNKLEQVIKFPEHDGDIEISFICDGVVDVFGSLASNICFFDRGDKLAEKFVAEIYRIAHVRSNRALSEILRITPARMEGGRSLILFQFSVEFYKRGNVEKVRVFQNHGYDADKYGKEYLGAQRILRSSRENFRGCRTNDVVWIKFAVDETGTPTEIEPVGTAASERCRNRLVKSLGDTKFIPGMANGAAVKTTFVEAFYSLEGMAGRKKGRI